VLQGLHQAATAALDPTAEGGGFSTIPAASLTAMQTCQVSVLAGSTTLEPTAQVQVQPILLEASVLPSLLGSQAWYELEQGSPSALEKHFVRSLEISHSIWQELWC